MGNLVPAIVWLPCTAVGAFVMGRSGRILGLGLLLLFGAQIAAWLTLNWTGLFDNKRMRRALLAELEVVKPQFRGFQAFVGFASPSHSSLLDPHEDVGFLLLTPNTLEFFGDAKTVVIRRSQIFGVRFKPNVHSLVGLGRWISIEGRLDGKPFEMMLEPRDRDTLLGNLLLGTALKDRIDNWLKRNEPRTE